MVRLCTPQKNVDVAKSQTSTSLQDELTKTLDTLHDLFDEIGLSSSAREGREESVYSALNAALQEQLDLVNDEKEKLTKECQKLIVSIKQLEQSLDDNKNGRRNSNDDRVTAPLTKCLQGLKEKHDNVKKRHAERYASVRKLAQALEQYASRLESSTIQIPLPPATNDPTSITTFDLSQSYYERLEAEFDRVYQEFTKRVAAVKSISRDIVSLYGELGIPNSQTDQSIIDFGASEPERLGLKKDDIERLRGKKEKLLDEKEKRQAQVEDLKNEIGDLWEKLGVEAQEQRVFMAQHKGCDSKTICGLESELDRLMQLKQEHLHVFIENAREALAELWEKLYFSEEEILYFSPAHSDVMSDSLLAAHESEIQRLQDLLNERAPIISLIDKHRSLIDDRESLAASANDSSRLISRGGAGNRDPTRLLREEKMRKRIAKELPKVEVELKRALERWEDEYGEAFLVKGEDYLQTLMSTSAVCQSRAGATSRQSVPTPTGRARANTASSATGPPRTLSRPTTSGGPVAKPGPRPKTPSARPKTPNAQPLRSKTPTTDRFTVGAGSTTIGRSGGRSLGMANAREAATLHRSGVKTPAPNSRIALPSGNTGNTTVHKSPSKGGMRAPLPTFSNDNDNDRSQSLTQTVGRFATSKRKPVSLSNLMGPPKMQPLTRQGSKDSYLRQEKERDRARSVISIRSVSPEERTYEYEEANNGFTPRPRRQYPQGSHDAPYISASQRELSEDSSNSPRRSRQYSLTSSTTLTSGSGSENWETFGGDSEYGDDQEERVDPKEAYYRNKLGYGEQKGGGGRGGGGVVMVRPVDSEDGWMSEEY